MGDCCRWAAVSLTAATVLLGNCRADNVKLDGGGSLSGSVASGSKSVSVRTSTGAVVVFDRAAVKQVNHGHSSATKAASTANSQKKRKLTPEEEKWMPKIHSLVSQVNGSNRDKAVQARNAFLKIDDPDVIPALSKYLGSGRDDEARHVYIVILHNMRGPKPVYYLVAVSLYDSSVQIRHESRQAIREDQLDSARHLYIAALRSGPPRLARIAAVGLGEIGDPRGESVPYLINALVHYGIVATMTEPAEYGVLYYNTIYATPGLKLNDPSLIYDGQTVGSSTIPVYLGPSGMTPSEEARALAKVRNLGHPVPLTSGLDSHVDLSARGTGTYLVTPAVADVYRQPVIGEISPAHDKKIRGKADHPEVLDALLKITDQKYPGHGFNQDRWRSWWAVEKINRDLQKPPTPDRVVPAGNTAH